MTESTLLIRQTRITVLAVRLGADLHAIPITVVEEVLPALPIETIPDCAGFVRGVVFVRGRLIPVLDAAERLGIRNHVRPHEPHIVCLRTAGRLVGVEFDEAVNLMELDLDEFLPADQFGARSGLLTGLVERDGQIIRVLDPEQLLAKEELAELAVMPRIRQEERSLEALNTDEDSRSEQIATGT